MTKRIEAVTFGLSFFKGDQEKPVTFTINVDLDSYDDPKDAAIDHVLIKCVGKLPSELDGFVPKFKTFKVFHTRKLSDLAW